MKNVIKIVFVIAVFALCCNVSAQNLKLAHINLNELIVSMPEFDSVQVKLQKVGQDLENAIEEMQVEFNKKNDEYQKNQANWTEIVRQAKTEELSFMYQRLQSFQQQASENYQQESDKFMQPVLDKANKAIESVAKEQNITYVFIDNPQILLFKAVGTLDLLSSVKKYLGIKN